MDKYRFKKVQQFQKWKMPLSHCLRALCLSVERHGKIRNWNFKKMKKKTISFFQTNELQPPLMEISESTQRIEQVSNSYSLVNNVLKFMNHQII